MRLNAHLHWQTVISKEHLLTLVPWMKCQERKAIVFVVMLYKEPWKAHPLLLALPFLWWQFEYHWQKWQYQWQRIYLSWFLGWYVKKRNNLICYCGAQGTKEKILIVVICKNGSTSNKICICPGSLDGVSTKRTILTAVSLPKEPRQA